MIGIDLDNTIADHDAAFRGAALAAGITVPEAACPRLTLRDRLRSEGREREWTALQGRVYGPLMSEARPFAGVIRFLCSCRTAGMPVAIVSQRTRHALAGEPHDLHDAARAWLVSKGFHDPSAAGLPEALVFLEEGRPRKLARIAALGCTHFIDDLPEVLASEAFPPAVHRILFDPRGAHVPPSGVVAVRSWPEVAALVLKGGQ